MEPTIRGGALAQRKSEALEVLPGGAFRARVSLGSFGRHRITIKHCTESEAEKRRDVMTDSGRLLVAAGHGPRAKGLLEDMGNAPTAAEFRELVGIAEGMCKGKVRAKKTPGTGKTFRQVGEWWTSGDGHRDFPDQIEAVSVGYLDECAKRLAKAVYPHIGDKPISQITREDCDAVMRRLPAPPGKRTTLTKATRRHYAGLVSRVLSLAELAGHIERSPLPRGWLPKLGAKKRFPILYASEDRTLLACKAVPLEFRLLYGFLHREGVRRGEAAALQWYELDLDNGTIALDENKTDHPRWWKLGPGVAEALAIWSKLREAKPEERVFTDEFSRPLQLDHLTDVLRVHLTKAGLTRADLTSEGPNKGQFGTHCFRRSMVTRNLALGRNEDWVRQRTGHKSEQLLTYRQAAKSLAELDPGEVDPLALAIPEFAGEPGKVGPEVGLEIIAPVAELADAQDSGSCARKGVSVRPRPGALK